MPDGADFPGDRGPFARRTRGKPGAPACTVVHSWSQIEAQGEKRRGAPG